MNLIEAVWHNSIQPNTSVIIIVAQLLIDFYFIYRIGALSSNKKKLNRESFAGIYITISILVVFAMLAISYLKVNYDSFKSATSGATVDPISASIANMQTATLAISSLVVTLASIIIAILTLYRDRKTELNNQAIDESLKKLAKADAELQALSSIISIQFIDERQRECYHDAILQYLKEIEDINDDFLYNRFRVTQLSVMNGIAQIEKDPIKQQEQYQKIVEIAEKIINDKNTTTLDKQFSVLEILHALYYIIKLKIDQCPDSADYDIDKAKRYISNRSLFGNDSFGHIANTKGLIHLWSGIAKSRVEDNEKAVYYFKESLKYFNEALYINPNKKEFLNHKGVALQQLYDIEPSVETRLELKNTLELTSSLSPKYGKGQLNYASFMVRELRVMLGLKPLSNFPDYQTKISKEYSFETLNEYALAAKNMIISAKELCPLMINCDYKMGELLTLIIMIKRDYDKKYDQDVEEANRAFRDAEEKNKEHLSYLYCKYAYLTLWDETKEEAENLKSLIKKKKNIK